MPDTPEKDTPEKDTPEKDTPEKDDRLKEFADPPSGPWGTRETIQKGGGGARKPTLALHEGVIPLDELPHLMAVAVCGESEPIQPSDLLKMVSSMEDLLHLVPATRLFGMFTLKDLQKRFKGRDTDLQKIEKVVESLPRESETSVGNVATGLFKPPYANQEMEYRGEIDDWIASGELKIRKPLTGGIYSPADYAHRWYGEPVVLVDEDLREFLRVRGIELKIRPAEQSRNPRKSAGWVLHSPQRKRVYTDDVYAFLKKAHDAGAPCPTAQDMLKAWSQKLPRWALRAIDGRLEYMDDNGKVKKLTRKNLGDVIRRIIKKTSR